MDKKVTIKDVAEAAGVCKATVSYVLNNRKDQSISEETKKKVWQVVNMLNYRPNFFAQNMRVAQEKRMVAVYFPKKLSVLEKILYFDFLEELKGVFHGNGYEIVLLDSTAERVNTADAIIACGVTREEFFALGGSNFIPLISIDCQINDPLFFEIAYDYAALKEKAGAHFRGDYRFVCTTPRDGKLGETIREVFPDAVFADSLTDLQLVSCRNILVTQKAMGEVLSSLLDCSVFYPEDLLAAKAARTAECVKLAMSHEAFLQHVFKI